MININNNIQIPSITKNKSMNIGSPSNTNDNLFNELVEEIQKKTSTNNEINTVSEVLRMIIRDCQEQKLDQIMFIMGSILRREQRLYNLGRYE